MNSHRTTLGNQRMLGWALGLLLLALPATLHAQFTYTTSGGGITITGYTGPGGDVTLPDTIDGLPVTSIGQRAFENSAVRSVTMPDSVTSIGFQAFVLCTSLANVTIGNGVTSIGAVAFDHCYSLAGVTIPRSVTSIGEDAFSFCTSLSAITVDFHNPNYSSVDGVLFNKSQSTLIVCPARKTGGYTIPGSVTSISNFAFRNCTNLSSVSIPNSLAYIPFQAFVSCTSLTSITIPASVTSIGSMAFYGCAGLTNVVIPESVGDIGQLALAYCTSLISVTIPDSVTSIGDFAFAGCTSLTAIDVALLNTAYSSVDGVLCNKSQETLIQCPVGKMGGYRIPDSVTRIRDAAFKDCTSLTSIVIPDSVTSIDSMAFAWCANLASVTIGNGVTSIGGLVFNNCTSLTGIYFQGNAPSLGDGVTGNYSATVYYLPGTTGWGPTFGDLPATLWNPDVPCAYSIDNGTIIFTKYMGSSGVAAIPDKIDGLFVTSIGYEAFAGGTNLTSVMIPDSVTNIGDEAFEGCVNLANVTIGNGVTSIGDWAFLGCTNLTAIDVASLNPAYSSLDGVLFNKVQTTLIQCPGGIMGGYRIPDSVTSVGDHAFFHCTSLASVMIPNSVTSIGGAAFMDCTSLTSVTIPSSVAHWSTVPWGMGGMMKVSMAFAGCTNLASVTLADGITYIPKMVFTGCTSLTSIVIPDSVINIEYGAFGGCTNLGPVYFRGDAPTEENVFSEANNVTVYYLPGTTGWGSMYAGGPTALWIPITPNLPSFVPDKPLKLVTHSPAPATVRVQRSVNLVDWEDWETVSRDAGPSELHDTDAGTEPYRFYRGIEE